MQITPFKTHKITVGTDLFAILDKYLPPLEENSIVAITSKIISLCQKDVVKIGTIDKDDLIKQVADFYIRSESEKYGRIMLTMKNNILSFAAGIDESNSNGNYVLWPHDIQDTTNKIWNYLREKHNL